MAEPKFITWKRYGFRHIILPGSEYNKTYTIYDGSSVTDLRFKTLCNKSEHAVPIAGDYNYIKHDIHGEDRPLCGTCAKLLK